MMSALELAGFAAQHAAIARNLGIKFETFWKNYVLADKEVFSFLSSEERSLVAKLGAREFERLTDQEVSKLIQVILPINNHYAKLVVKA